ncbi:hypothetical protein CP973_12335 [Streptomyces albofaciens JCM 4342]|nr:hypothetical protein CP973_12335 [Streptomyces albofaciens JCM 4342]
MWCGRARGSGDRASAAGADRAAAGWWAPTGRRPGGGSGWGRPGGGSGWGRPGGGSGWGRPGGGSGWGRVPAESRAPAGGWVPAKWRVPVGWARSGRAGAGPR